MPHDPENGPEGAEDLTEPIVEADGPRTEIAWGVVVLLTGLALVVVFAVQNSQEIPLTFLWMSGSFALSFVILITVLASVLLTVLFGSLYRRRRRQRRAEREELRRLRGEI